MLESVVALAVVTLYGYALMGLVFALPFVVFGVGRLDPHATDGTWGFRILILPGAAALWPLLSWRLLRGSGPPREHNAHRDQAQGEVRP